MAGRDGVAVAASVLTVAAEVAIRNDQVVVAGSVEIADAAAKFSLHDPSSVNVNVLGANGNVTIGGGEVNFSGSFGGSNGVNVQAGTDGVSVSVGGVTLISCCSFW